MQAEEGAPGAASHAEDEDRGDWHVVSTLRNLAGDSVFTSWLGYPKSRNCWRSLKTHFPTERPDSGAALVASTRARLSVVLLSGEPSTQQVLAGRPPPAKDIRTTASSAKQPAAQQGNPPPKKARTAKRDYETKFHTIRIDQTGVHEFRGVKRGGGVTVTSAASEQASTEIAEAASHGGAPAAARSDGTNGTVGDGDSLAASRSGEAGGSGCAGSSGSHEEGVVGTNGGSSKPGATADERSELWAAHRQLNEAAWRSSKGVLFRVEVTEVVSSQVRARVPRLASPAPFLCLRFVRSLLRRLTAECEPLPGAGDCSLGVSGPFARRCFGVDWAVGRLRCDAASCREPICWHAQHR